MKEEVNALLERIRKFIPKTLSEEKNKEVIRKKRKSRKY